MSGADMPALVARSRAAQGLPPHVEDPATLRRIASIFVGKAVPPWPPTERDIAKSRRAAERRKLRAEDRERAAARSAQANDRYVARRWADDLALLTPEQLADVARMAREAIR